MAAAPEADAAAGELTPLRAVVLASLTSLAAVLCYNIQLAEHGAVSRGLYRQYADYPLPWPIETPNEGVRGCSKLIAQPTARRGWSQLGRAGLPALDRRRVAPAAGSR